jgi:electron transport complex protein RnfB
VSEATVEQIDALLPQTQCAKCGYPGCRPYAEAIARGEAEINGCPPGGATALRNLAALLGRDLQGLALPPGAEQPRAAAFIREDLCIGCTLCIPACPVDAIVGAHKQMHTVLIAECTGCELCAPACPVDCIDMLPLTELARRGSRVAAGELHTPVAAHARRWRRRYQIHQLKSAREAEERNARRAAKPEVQRRASAAVERKRAAVRAALERARARRGVQ